jgi:hypothetical protein
MNEIEKIYLKYTKYFKDFLLGDIVNFDISEDSKYLLNISYDYNDQEDS